MDMESVWPAVATGRITAKSLLRFLGTAFKKKDWYWFFTADQHICNDHGKCIAPPDDYSENANLIQWDRIHQTGQTWQWFVDDQLINLYGKCLASAQDRKDINSPMVGWTCFRGEQGQHWHFEVF